MFCEAVKSATRVKPSRVGHVGHRRHLDMSLSLYVTFSSRTQYADCRAHIVRRTHPDVRDCAYFPLGLVKICVKRNRRFYATYMVIN